MSAHEARKVEAPELLQRVRGHTVDSVHTRKIMKTGYLQDCPIPKQLAQMGPVP